MQQSKRVIEIIVGLFMLAGMLALAVLALEVSGLSQYGDHGTYTVTAEFDNIGGLKVRAPVKIGGVRVGEISKINLDRQNFRARVYMRIAEEENNIPVDSSASILTEGLLGANYISIGPGYDEEILKEGGRLEETHSALVLENLIGQLLFQLKGDKKTDKSEKPTDKKIKTSTPTVNISNHSGEKK